MLGTKSRDLDDLRPEAHVCEPEAAADQPAVAEQVAHILGQRIGRDVEILRLDADQDVAHATTDQEGLIAGIAQPVQHFQGAAGNLRSGDRMLGAGNDYRGGAPVTGLVQEVPGPLEVG